MSYAGESLAESRARYARQFPVPSGGGGGAIASTSSSPPPSTQPEVIEKPVQVNYKVWQDYQGRWHDASVEAPQQGTYATYPMKTIIGTGMGVERTTYSGLPMSFQEGTVDWIKTMQQKPEVIRGQLQPSSSQQAVENLFPSLSKSSDMLISRPDYSVQQEYNPWTRARSVQPWSESLESGFRTFVDWGNATLPNMGIGSAVATGIGSIAYGLPLLGTRFIEGETKYGKEALAKPSWKSNLLLPRMGQLTWKLSGGIASIFIEPFVGGVESGLALREGKGDWYQLGLSKTLTSSSAVVTGELLFSPVRYAEKLITQPKVAGYEYQKVKGARVVSYLDVSPEGIYKVNKFEPILTKPIKVTALVEIPKPFSGIVKGGFISTEKVSKSFVIGAERLIINSKFETFGKMEGTIVEKIIPEKSYYGFEKGKETLYYKITGIEPEAVRTEAFAPASAGTLKLTAGMSERGFDLMSLQNRNMASIIGTTFLASSLKPEVIMPMARWGNVAEIKFTKARYFGEGTSSYEATMLRSTKTTIDKIPFDLNQNEMGVETPEDAILFGKQAPPFKKFVGKKPFYITETKIGLVEMGKNSFMKEISAFKGRKALKPVSYAIDIPKEALKTRVKPIVSYDYRNYDGAYAIAEADLFKQIQGSKVETMLKPQTKVFASFSQLGRITPAFKIELGSMFLQRQSEVTLQRPAEVIIQKQTDVLIQKQAQAEITLQRPEEISLQKLIESPTTIKETTTEFKPPFPLKLDKKGLRGFKFPKLALGRERKKGKRKEKLFPLADWLSKTQTEFKTGKPATNLPSTPFTRKLYAKTILSGGMRFPTAQQFKGFKSLKFPKTKSLKIRVF
jgi:hypothetical protein